MASKNNPGNAKSEAIKKDAAGQFAKGLDSSDNNGVASVKPRAITGSDDATVNRTHLAKSRKRIGT